MWQELISSVKAKLTDERLNPFVRTTERGRRSTEAQQQRAIYEQLTPSYELRATIMEIRQMDRQDGTVKQIHNRIAKQLTKGGLRLNNPTGNKRIEKLYQDYIKRCQLDNRLKLISDARGLITDGSLPLQWVLDDKHTKVMRCVRMPAETIKPIVGIDGQFLDPRKAYAQYDYVEARDIAFFARGQMDIARLDPDNFDDAGCMGRPLLDAARKKWRQVEMNGDDMVLRRRTRAPMRTSHALEGATSEELAEYKRQVESEEGDFTNNYYSNRKGAVTAIQGDENLGDIGDVAMLMDSFFAGTPMPKALLGHVEGLSRDVLTDMKQEFYDDLDTLQDSITGCYEFGFRVNLLLHGINPDHYQFNIAYGERLTETLTQKTDRALKIMALGASRHSAFTVAGLDPAEERERLEEEFANLDAYPINELGVPGVEDELEAASKRGQNIKINPDQAGKSESATSITNA